MTSIILNKEAPAEFFSDIMITAFDAQYGGAWEWFEPVGENWLTTEHADPDHKHEDGSLCIDDLWMSVEVQLKEDCQLGHPPFDGPITIDHAAIAAGISRIVNDDYAGIWRKANDMEEKAYAEGKLRREHRWNEKEDRLEIETGETARGLRGNITRALQDLEAGDIDAYDAGAIVQAGAFGKVPLG